MHDDLVAELSHQINSPLAAIRNALYLASCRTGDPELLYYLQLADDEVMAISIALKNARTPMAAKSANPVEPTVLEIKTRRVAA